MAEQLDAWIQGERPKLAKQAWKLVEENREVQAALAALDPTPLRTLLGAATNATCLAEILIVLRYQGGRERFNEALVQSLERAITEAVTSADAKRTAPEGQQDEAEARVAASLLGLVVRLHRYHHEKARAGRVGR